MAHDNQLRSSQVITTYGPGSMVDFPEASVLIAGLDQWRYDRSLIPIIREPRLEAKATLALGAHMTLRTPPPAAERDRGFMPDITGYRFPEWFIVQHPPVETAEGYRRRRLVHLNSLDRMQYRDVDGRYSVVPVRFVRACRRGHIGDIDWVAFLHGEHAACPRDLWIEERGTSGDLDEVVVACECGESRVMSQAARRDLGALGTCNGARPWLGPGNREKCGEPNRLLIRSASNAYFPQLLSVISLPDTHREVDTVVRRYWADFLSDVDGPDTLSHIRKKPSVAAALQGIADEDVLRSVERVRRDSGDADRPVKEVEFETLSDSREELGSDKPEGDFYARRLPRDAWEASWMIGIERVVLVHRLREVIAQVGFTRFESAGPDISGELDLGVGRAALAIDADWLPACENRGEGVFLQFKPDAISDWMARPEVEDRRRALANGFDIWRSEHSHIRYEFPGLPYYLLHSLSHLLMTAVSVECGYPASSLRERVYAMPGRYGLLIYTGSSDAEGTLGGLIEASRDIRRHVRRALDNGLLCSNDPVCAFHVPSENDPQPLHGSACHGCLLVSETSCEQRNDYLDRALVVPTIENLGAEFFTGLV